MNNPDSRRFVYGLLTVLILTINVSCSSSPAVKTESWEVFVQYPVHHFYSGPINQRIFQLSPDGTKLASLESHGDFINLVITDLSSGTRHLATNFNDVMVTGYTWANNERLLFYTSDELAIHAVDFNGNNGRTYAHTTVVCEDECLASEETVFLVNYVQVMSRLPGKPDRVLVSSNYENVFEPSLYELDIHTGNVIAVNTGGDNPEIYQWPTDGEGRILQATLAADQVESILQFNTTTRVWSEIPAIDNTYEPDKNIHISGIYNRLEHELNVDNIRISSIDDNQVNAVLMASSDHSTPDYYLYNFEDESISLLASSPSEVALIEASPSQIRVELIAVDETYQHPRMVVSTPEGFRRYSRSTEDIAARKGAVNRN